MPRYEYKVVPAPSRGPKVRGKRSPEERFALGLAETINDLAAEGWEFQRSECLPGETRSGLFGTTRRMVDMNVLVFRRAIEEQAGEPPIRPVRPPRPETVRDLRAARGLGPTVRSESPGSSHPA